MSKGVAMQICIEDFRDKFHSSTLGRSPWRSVNAALTCACLLLTSNAALAARKSNAECKAFADKSAEQLQAANEKHCGFKAGWNGTWQSNYDYCKRAEPASIDKISHNREVMMNRCVNVCPGYANAAVNDIRVATEGGCVDPTNSRLRKGVTGPDGRWSGNYDAHFAWCMSGVSDKVLNRERDVRATEAPRCQICSDYATQTMKLVSQEQTRQCGFESFESGDQWRPDRDMHFRHCMGYSLNDVQAWANHQSAMRSNQLSVCPSLQTQAMCSRIADHAMVQRALLDAHHCDDEGLGKNRWNQDRAAHYRGCLLDPATGPSEERAREAHLLACGATQHQAPKTAQLNPNAECKFGALVSLTACLNENGTPMANWDVKGYWPSCGLGSTPAEAEKNAKLQMLNASVPLNSCKTHTTPITGCSCDAGVTSSGLSIAGSDGANQRGRLSTVPHPIATSRPH